ncbi:MAG: integrase core domain-containing protein [Planctomycetota bacterium]|nr:integrase core domain-containing protein [Planctomycetota bacterium]
MNRDIESFHTRLRDELLGREVFVHIDVLRYVVVYWRMDYNHYRSHGSLG